MVPYWLLFVWVLLCSGHWWSATPNPSIVSREDFRSRGLFPCHWGLCPCLLPFQPGALPLLFMALPKGIDPFYLPKNEVLPLSYLLYLSFMNLWPHCAVSSPFPRVLSPETVFLYRPGWMWIHDNPPSSGLTLLVCTAMLSWLFKISSDDKSVGFHGLLSLVWASRTMFLTGPLAQFPSMRSGPGYFLLLFTHEI